MVIVLVLQYLNALSGMVLHDIFYRNFCLSILSLQVVNTLTSSKQLLDLIKMVDSVYHSKQAGSGKPMLNSLYQFVPSIREHLKVH